MSESRLRIVSDLHLAENGSHLHRMSMLEPLFEGIDQLILNGDTLETRFLDVDDHLRERRDEFADFAAEKGDRLLPITGNHDPDLSDTHHLDLANGAILVTHGDTMFPEMAPWGWEAHYFKDEQERLLALEAPDRRRLWEVRLGVCKQAVLNIRDLSPRYPGRSSHPWKRRMRFLWSIRRVDRILRAWRETPAAAAALAREYRPAAEVVIVGHTHRPGVWRMRDRTVINTGSLVPPLGAMAVDIVGNHIEVRRMAVREGALRLGRIWKTMDLLSADRETAARPVVG